MKTYYCAFAGVLTLAACGGSGGGSPVVVVPALEVIEGDATIDVDLTRSGEFLVVSNGAAATLLPVADVPNHGTFRTGAVSEGDRILTAITNGFVSVGSGSVVSGASSFGTADGDALGLSYERLGETALPTQGSATLTGDYLGFLLRTDSLLFGPSNGTAARGSATENVDFADQTVDGSITDREFINLQSGDPLAEVDLADVTLEPSELTDTGTFAGAISGGALTTTTETFSVLGEMTYDGLIAGAEATEAVGIVRLTHQGSSGITYVETGGFAAGH